MVITQELGRLNRLLLVALLVFATAIPLLSQPKAEAYALPSNRFIKMSSSADGSIAAGQDVTYQVSFITNQGGASASIGGLVMEFCSNSPIIGDTCTAPVGLNVHAFLGDNTLAVPASQQVGITDWAKSTTNATANRLILTRTAAAVATNTTISFDMGFTANNDGVTNPTTVNTTFYGRILTFATATGAQQYAPTNIDNSGANVVHDAGGVALSTAAQITITAKVPEKLTFCVFTVDGSVPNTCGTAAGSTAPSGTAVTLGDNNGVLSDTGPFVDKNAKYTIATNALYEVAIRIKGGTLKTSPACSEAVGQNCSIDAIGAAAAASAPGTEQFGFCTYQSAGTGLVPTLPYDHVDCNTTTQTAGTPGTGGAGTAQFALDNNNLTGTTSTYGQEFARKPAGTFSTGILAFIGNITTTTEPGIYTTTLIFIATGTY